MAGLGMAGDVSPDVMTGLGIPRDASPDEVMSTCIKKTRNILTVSKQLSSQHQIQIIN